MRSAYDPAVAVFLSQASPLAKQVLAKVADLSAASSWALSKELNTNPDKVEPVLSEWRDQNLVASDELGLQGMYYLTQLGYLSRDMF